MSKLLNGTAAAAYAWMEVDVPGGGWVTGITVAFDGTVVARDDTGLAYTRGPNATRWRAMLQYGTDVPATELIWRNPVQRAYDVDICQADSSRIWLAQAGRLYKIQGGVYTRVSAYKSGNFDIGLYADHKWRIGGGQLRCDPINPDIFALGHTTDGLYYSENGGTNVTLHPNVLAPVNPSGEVPGIRGAFDKFSVSGGKCLRYACFVPGRGVYNFTNGLGNAPTLIAGGPTRCTSIAYSNGRIFVCGDGENDTQLWVWNGTQWLQPAGATGMAVAAHPTDTTKILMMNVGGETYLSSDSGVTFPLTAPQPNPFLLDATGDAEWMDKTSHGYASTGACCWEVRSGVNRWWTANGIGTFCYDNPPRTLTTQKWKARSLGIQNILLMSIAITPKGTRLFSSQDRAGWTIRRERLGRSAVGHDPNYNAAIRHGDDHDYAPDNEDYRVLPLLSTEPLHIMSDGKTYVAQTGTPTYTHPSDGVINIQGGMVAVTATGKFIWCGTSHAPMKVFDNGTWSDPVFRTTVGGTPVNMSNAGYHIAYWQRRKTLVADKSTPGRALVFIYPKDGNAASPVLGLWETLDHGKNWLLVKAGWMIGGAFDQYGSFLRLVPNSSTDLFWAAGNSGTYNDNGSTLNNGNDLLFSNNKGASTTIVPGFKEVEDVTCSLRESKNARSWWRVNVLGWRQVAGVWTHGVWWTDSFDRLNPAAAITWNYITYPQGRMPGGGLLAADLGAFPGVDLVVPNGNAYTLTDQIKFVAN